MSSVQQNVIKHKVGLLNLAAELGNVSRACKVMGFSRDTFYRYQAAVETGGSEAAITAFAVEQPAFGQVRVSNELRKRGAVMHVGHDGFLVRSVQLEQIAEINETVTLADHLVKQFLSFLSLQE